MSVEAPAFVDTNVLVYAFDESDGPRRAIAAGLIDDLISGDRLRISTQVMQEFFVTVTRKLPAPLAVDDAVAVMDDLCLWHPHVVDCRTIREAALLSRDAKLSFWDSLIVVSASRCGASTLYTEDLADGTVLLGVRIANPFARPADSVHDSGR